MDKKEKLSNVLSGIAGEYFVAAELSRRGFMASVTLRNNDSVDIHASKLNDDKMFAIQVKTNQVGNRNWPLNAKAESHFLENLFYVFVSLRGNEERAEYFIVPSIIVAEQIKNNHQFWLKEPGKKGQPHNDNPLRKFFDNEGKYLDRWELLS